MSAADAALRDAAVAWARKNKKAFARALTQPEKYPGENSPVSVFMAGSPGAGKTEAAKALASEVGPFLRIDPDEFRASVPGYTGANSWLVQDAVSILLEKVLDFAFEQKQSFLLDGTMSSYGVAERNVERSIRKGRAVQVLYVYQEPALAWKFVQDRELTEGRRIPGDRFVQQFFESRNVVNALKVKFGNAIKVDVLLKDIDGTNRRYLANVSDLNHASPLRYSVAEVESIVRSTR
ncbi:MAG: zeta toxin family protein [Proteobacteria bacterium]|nr:zeta toxin family protein [Pseudomonadota bacterium]